MARLSRFVTVAVLLGGATVSLSACTGGSDPIASPSPSVSTVVTPSPSVSPSPTPLTDAQLLALIPENARGDDFLSASNFAKFFVVESQAMLLDGDDGLLRAVSESGCTFCEASFATLAAMRDQGLTASGGGITVSPDLAVGGLQADGTWNASFDIEVATQEFIDSSGAVITSNPAESLRVGVVLIYKGSRWGVVDVGSEPR